MRFENLFHAKIKYTWYQFKIFKKFHFGCNFSIFIVSLIFGGNWLEWIHALVVVFGTNIGISTCESKQEPKWRYLVGKKFQNFSETKIFSNALPALPALPAMPAMPALYLDLSKIWVFIDTKSSQNIT